MSKPIIAGKTSNSLYFKMPAGSTITNLDIIYTRDGAAAVKSDCVALGSAAAAYSANGAIYVDGTNDPELIRADIPNAAFATGVKSVRVTLRDATTEDDATIDVELVDVSDKYPGGWVYLDSSKSNTNTQIGTDGTLQNPVSTIAAARTLALSLGSKICGRGTFSAVTLDFTDFSLKGNEGNFTLSGDTTTPMDITNAILENVFLSGKYVCGINTKFDNCEVGTNSSITSSAGLAGKLRNCLINGSIYFKDVSETEFLDCKTVTTASDNNFVLPTGGNATVRVHNFCGKINFQFIDNNDQYVLVNGDEKCKVLLESSCTDVDILTFTGVSVTDESTISTAKITYNNPELMYPDGYVYVDTAASNTRDAIGIHGTKNQPVSTMAAGNTIAMQLGKKIMFRGDETNITEDLTGYEIKAWGMGTIHGSAGTPMNLSKARLIGMGVQGTVICNNDINFYPVFEKCILTSISGIAGHFWNCSFNSWFRLADGDDHAYIYDGKSGNGGLPQFDFVNVTSGEDNSIQIFGYHGNMVVKNGNSGEGSAFVLYADGGVEVTYDNTNTDDITVMNGYGKFINTSGFYVDLPEWKDIEEVLRDAYPDATVYYDAGATANTNTTVGQDGTPHNPVTSEAAAKTLAEAVGMKICIKGAYALTLDYSAGFSFSGCDGAAEITCSGAADISDCDFEKIGVSGAFLSNTDTTKFTDCQVHDITSGSLNQGLAGFLRFCGMYGDIAVQGLLTSEVHLYECFEAEITAGNKPTLDWTDNTRESDALVRDFKGQLNFKNCLNASIDIQVNNAVSGYFELDSSINLAGVDIIMQGIGTLVDNTTAANVDTTNWVELADIVSTGDWTATEKENIRNALGVDGTKTNPTGGYGRLGNPFLLSDGVTQKSVSDMLSEMAEKVSGGATYNRTTDSLEALSDGIGSLVQFRKNTAFNNFPIFMVDDTDHITGKTGLSVAGTVSIDGGAFGALTNPITAIGNGWYKVDLTAAELNGDSIVLRFTATGADDRAISFPTNS